MILTHLLLVAQVLYGLLSVTPKSRLSEAEITKGILAWAKLIKLTPVPGVSSYAVEQWAGKMAYGAMRIAILFKKIWNESPLKAKSAKLSALKCRLNDKIAEEQTTSVASPVSSPCSAVSFLSALNWKTLDGHMAMAATEVSTEAPSSQGSPGQLTSPEKESASLPPQSKELKLKSAQLTIPNWARN